MKELKRGRRRRGENVYFYTHLHKKGHNYNNILTLEKRGE